jgi:hypothetical protein
MREIPAYLRMVVIYTGFGFSVGCMSGGQDCHQ